jgi:hypothetical protein
VAVDVAAGEGGCGSSVRRVCRAQRLAHLVVVVVVLVVVVRVAVARAVVALDVGRVQRAQERIVGL